MEASYTELAQIPRSSGKSEDFIWERFQLRRFREETANNVTFLTNANTLRFGLP